MAEQTQTGAEGVAGSSSTISSQQETVLKLMLLHRRYSCCHGAPALAVQLPAILHVIRHHSFSACSQGLAWIEVKAHEPFDLYSSYWLGNPGHYKGKSDPACLCVLLIFV